MLSQACVKNSVHMGRVHVRGHAWWEGNMYGGGVHGRGHVWQRGMHGRGRGVPSRGHAWQGDMCDGREGGGASWQEKRSLQWVVRILLECILIGYENQIKSHCTKH